MISEFLTAVAIITFLYLVVIVLLELQIRAHQRGDFKSIFAIKEKPRYQGHDAFMMEIDEIKRGKHD